MGAGSDYANISGSTIDREGYDVADYANIQYHTPADLLPFGIAAKVGYAPNIADTGKGASYKAAGSINTAALGRAVEQLQISAAPIDGLSIKGDVARTTGQEGNVTTADEGVSANLGAKYTMGQFTVGYYQGGYNDATSTAETVIYEKDGYSVQFDVNESLSISYGEEDLEQQTRAKVADTATAGTKTSVTNNIESLQLAYTTGGMTVGITRVEESKIDFGTASDENTILSVAVSF